MLLVGLNSFQSHHSKVNVEFTYWTRLRFSQVLRSIWFHRLQGKKEKKLGFKLSSVHPRVERFEIWLYFVLKKQIYTYNCYINWFILPIYIKGIPSYLCLYVSARSIATIHLLKVLRFPGHAIIDVLGIIFILCKPLKKTDHCHKDSRHWIQNFTVLFILSLHIPVSFGVKQSSPVLFFLSQNISLPLHKFYIYSQRTILMSDAIVCAFSWNKC